MKRIAVAAWLFVPGAALAQEAPRERAPFTGAYAGLGAGVHEHRFDLEISASGISRSARTTYRDAGAAAAAFAGYDLPIGRIVRVGAELSGHVGGGDGPRASLGPLFYEQRPRWGVTAVARAGIVAGDRVMVYGTLGYGGYRYRLRSSVFVENASDWGDSLAYGGGVEYRISDRIGVRADVRNLSFQATQFLVGVPVRF